MTAWGPEAVPTGLFIGGRWEPAEGRDTVDVLNPATGATIAAVVDAGPEDALRAVEAADAAQEAFAALPAGERSAMLHRVHALVLENKETLAGLMTAEMGKPLAEARGEVDYSAGYLEWYAHEGVRIQGSHSRSPGGRGQITLSREPVGVSFLVTPWNFPLAMGTRKIAPAIATGCAVVIKPAEKTPLTMLYLAELLRRAGVPDGTVNVITTADAASVSEPILAGGKVRHLSFTGSTRVGKLLHSQCSQHMVRTSLELGGNAPFLVFDDSDLDRAVTEVSAAKLRNMGQACTAANRILVQETVAEEFATKLAASFAELSLGDGAQPGVDLGPMIDGASAERLQELVDDAVSGGARVLTGGELPAGPGSFYPATVLVDVPRDARLLAEEIFGPVAPIVAFDDEDDAVEIANATEYGLAGYLITPDLVRANRVARRLEVGMVGINSGIISDVAAPLGGVKSSGLGREGGILGIEEFLEYKYSFTPDA